MGPQRDGVWRETGIVERFPTNGLPILWRAPVHAGYSGPAVVGKRLFMLDREAGQMAPRKKGDKSKPEVPGDERVLCLDAKTGKPVWEYRYDCPYTIAYPTGPRTTPVVAGGKVFTLGAMGDLLCLNAQNGALIWSRHFLTDFHLDSAPVWGWASHPLLDGDRLICLVGGSNSVVVAFDKDTGKERWSALSAQEIGYAPPVIYRVHGQRELIVWHPDAVNGLDPKTGKLLWSQKYPVAAKPQRPEVTIAMPRMVDDRLFLTSFYQGALMLQLTPGGPKVLWDRHSSSKSEMNDGLHSVMSTPMFDGNCVYGTCGFGELRCLDAKTGDRLWETYAANGGTNAFLATAFLTQHANGCFVWNDQDELILAKLLRQRFQEISRAKLLEPIEDARGRNVVWCPPAFANRCAYMHNGKELICVSLAAKPS